MRRSICLSGALAMFAITAPSGLVAQPASPAGPTLEAARPVGVPEIGMPVFSLDGQKVGSVEAVNMSADGKVVAISITTGSILGFGVKLVAIPPSKFAVLGDHVRVGLAADDIAALPHQGP
jgi:hypothetical protein